MQKARTLYDLMHEKRIDLDAWDATYDACVAICLPDEKNLSPEGDAWYACEQFSLELAKKVLVKEYDEEQECVCSADWTGFILENKDKLTEFMREHWNYQYDDEDDFVIQWIKELHLYSAGYIPLSGYKDYALPLIKSLKGQQDTEYHADAVAQGTEQEMSEDLPEMCYAFSEFDGIIIIKRGEKGFYKTEWSVKDKEGALALVGEKNEALGVTKEQEQAMQVGSMFGWSVPGANPACYKKGNATDAPLKQEGGLA